MACCLGPAGDMARARGGQAGRVRLEADCGRYSRLRAQAPTPTLPPCRVAVRVRDPAPGVRLGGGPDRLARRSGQRARQRTAGKSPTAGNDPREDRLDELHAQGSPDEQVENCRARARGGRGGASGDRLRDRPRRPQSDTRRGTRICRWRRRAPRCSQTPQAARESKGRTPAAKAQSLRPRQGQARPPFPLLPGPRTRQRGSRLSSAS